MVGMLFLLEKFFEHMKTFFLRRIHGRKNMQRVIVNKKETDDMQLANLDPATSSYLSKFVSLKELFIKIHIVTAQENNMQLTKGQTCLYFSFITFCWLCIIEFRIWMCFSSCRNFLIFSWFSSYMLLYVIVSLNFVFLWFRIKSINYDIKSRSNYLEFDIE